MNDRNKRIPLLRMIKGGLAVAAGGFILGVGVSMANPNNQPPRLGGFFFGVMWIGVATAIVGVAMGIGAFFFGARK